MLGKMSQMSYVNTVMLRMGYLYDIDRLCDMAYVS